MKLAEIIDIYICKYICNGKCVKFENCTIFMLCLKHTALEIYKMKKVTQFIMHKLSLCLFNSFWIL